MTLANNIVDSYASGRSRTIAAPVRYRDGEVVRVLDRVEADLRAHKSSTSRFPRHRETQMSMVSPASRSSSVSTESRWSGVPSTTSVSQVPQVPSVQEKSTSTPAPRTVSRTETSAGTVSVRPVRASTTSLQVVNNLLSNALVHTPPGTAVDVRVGTARAGATTGGTDRPGRTSGSPPLTTGTPICVIEVGDQGPGLPLEEAERVFERFYRVDPSRSRDHGGSGLGLAIATAIARGHGGRLELDTGAGAGCTFRLVLPVRD